MAIPNEPFTLTNLAYGAFGAAVTTLFAWIASQARSHIERRHKHEDETTAAEIQAEVEDRHYFRLAQQQLIDTLRARIKESEEDRANLWREFRGMQLMLASTQDELKAANGRATDCELLHKSDALRISSLERENLTLNQRLLALEAPK